MFISIYLGLIIVFASTVQFLADLFSRVKKALEALPQVDKAVVSHEAGTAIVTLNAEVEDEVLKKAVEAQDYPVTGIQ